MLVLTRKVGKRLIMLTKDGKVTVSVEEVRGFSVRIGIDAPKGVRIYREEVLNHIEQEALRAKEAQENQATPSP